MTPTKSRLVAAAATAALIGGGAAAVPAGADAHPYHLTVAKAKRVAKSRAYWDFDARVTRAKVDWFNRWSTRRIDVGVSGEWTTSHYDDGFSWSGESSCSATVVVKRSRRGRVSSRIEGLSCFYG